MTEAAALDNRDDLGRSDQPAAGAATPVTLSQRKIYILPTREGIYFALLVLFMVLAGINYQNSLIYALAFLLSSFFMVSILHTYRNLSGLSLHSAGSSTAFAGEDAAFDVIVRRKGERTYEAVTLGWEEDLTQGVDLIADREVRLRLFVPAKQRGLMDPGSLLIRTLYPVGLFRAWSRVDLGTRALIYPRPIPAGEIPFAAGISGEGDAQLREGADDFHDLRQYQVGDPLRHVAWKSYARAGELLTKQYAGYADRRVWLEWDSFPGMDREARLSRLCYWVLRLQHSNDAYGLRLPGIEIAPDRGEHHRDEILRQLALFETQPEPTA